MTYSIAARDADTGLMGVAVQSHYFGVGRMITWGEAGVGVVATQSFVEVSYGPRGLDLMRAGTPAPDALEQLVAADPGAPVRQVGMVDAQGRVGAHTGPACVRFSGHATGEQVTAQANMMERPTAWTAMVEAFGASRGLELAERLLVGLEAAEAEGGDMRGRQSAAVLVVGAERSDAPWDQRVVDLRVDDHEDPLGELRRLIAFDKAFRKIHAVLFGGLLFEPDLQPTDARLDRALDDLTDAQAVIGHNPEPSVWAALLLAKAGRMDEARQRLSVATGVNPRWTQFVAAMPAMGVIPNDSALLAG